MNTREVNEGTATVLRVNTESGLPWTLPKWDDVLYGMKYKDPYYAPGFYCDGVIVISN